MKRRELLKHLPPLMLASAMPTRMSGGGDKLAGKSRLLTAIVAYSFRNALKNKTMTYEDLVRLAADIDVDGLDLTVYWFPNTSDEFLLPLRRLAYKLAVDIYSISIRTDMCRPPGEIRDREVAEVKRWVDAAAKLGAGHIRVFGGQVPKNSTEDEAAGWAVETLKRGAEYSGSKGVILGLENHGGITGRAERVVQIVKQVNSPWVGISLDTGNFRTDGYSQIELCLPYAANVQLKTDLRVKGGKREPQDWDRIAGMLVKSGYKGYMALEYEAKGDPATEIPPMMKELRRITRKYSAA
jgi:sugar phosphate isomerase/epimerase